MKMSLILSPSAFIDNTTLKNRLSNLWGFLSGNFSGTFEGSWPPLGILYIGTAVRNAGFDVSILDASRDGLTYDKIIDWIKREKPDVVGLSSFSGTFPNTLEIIKRIDKEIPHVKIVVGGPHITFVAEQALKEYPCIDVVVRNEGEETILEILDAFRGRKKLKDIGGISFVHNKKVVHTPIREINTDIDKIPFPDRSLIRGEYINQLAGIKFFAGDKFTTITSSRGCPFSCTFCSCSAFRSRICTFRSVENFVDELEFLVGEGYTDIGVVDDNFLSNPLRAEKICDEIKERKLDFYWFCEGRVNEINSILMEKMKAVGCQTIYFGIESGSEKILKYYNKNITPSQSIKAVNAAKKTGMNIVGSFIVGAPVETKSEVVENLDLIRKLGVDVPQINILSVNPGTALWNEMILKNSEIGNYWKTGIQPVKIGMCEYSYEWLNDAVNDTYKKILFSPSFLSHQTIKSLTDPYRLKMIKKMAGLGSYKKS